MTINRIMVIGAGQMGGGIAQVAARAGLQVDLHDLKRALVDQRLAAISAGLDRAIDRESIDASEKGAILSRIAATTDLHVAATADFVIEAASENIAIKKQLFEELNRAARPGVIIASNTSSLSITELAASTNRPELVIGMHFMNPVPAMELVEVIRGLATSDATCQAVKDLAQRLGKTAVEVNDFPGFISNRLLMPMINEAIYSLYEGVADAESIDSVMKLGLHHPMGPLALADLIGLDTCLAIMQVLHDGFGDSKYRPCPLLRKMVVAGRLGKKSGHGFYRYD